MMEGAARALTVENQQLKEERERLRSLVNFFDSLQRGDPDAQGQQPGAVPTGLHQAAQAVVAGGTGLLERTGMSLLGVAGAVTDKVMSASLGKTPVGKDLNSIFDSHATEPHGLLAGVGGPAYQCVQRTAVTGLGTTQSGCHGDGSSGQVAVGVNSNALQQSNSEGALARIKPSQQLPLGDVQQRIGRSLSDGIQASRAHVPGGEIQGDRAVNGGLGSSDLLNLYGGAQQPVEVGASMRKGGDQGGFGSLLHQLGIYGQPGGSAQVPGGEGLGKWGIKLGASMWFSWPPGGKCSST
eukprot:s975_g9.t1